MSSQETASQLLPKVAAMKLTDASVAGLKLPEGKSELLVFDDTLPGFGLRIRGGVASEHGSFSTAPGCSNAV
jgi:hypothetical protein